MEFFLHRLAKSKFTIESVLSSSIIHYSHDDIYIFSSIATEKYEI